MSKEGKNKNNIFWRTVEPYVMTEVQYCTIVQYNCIVYCRIACLYLSWQIGLTKCEKFRQTMKFFAKVKRKSKSSTPTKKQGLVGKRILNLSNTTFTQAIITHQ